MGHWNDLDVLPIGTGNINMSEERALFYMWAISKSPLIFAADPNTIDDISAAELRGIGSITIN